MPITKEDIDRLKEFIDHIFEKHGLKEDEVDYYFACEDLLVDSAIHFDTARIRERLEEGEKLRPEVLQAAGGTFTSMLTSMIIISTKFLAQGHKHEDELTEEEKQPNVVYMNPGPKRDC